MKMQSAFNKILNRFGKEVTVTHRTPKTDGGEIVKDKDGHPVYDEETVTLKALIRIMKGSERIVENLILEPGEAIGKFKLSDGIYLNKNSSLTADYGNGLIYNWNMTKPIQKLTHFEVNLKKI